jgi:hypothetical protein
MGAPVVKHFRRVPPDDVPPSIEYAHCGISRSEGDSPIRKRPNVDDRADRHRPMSWLAAWAQDKISSISEAPLTLPAAYSVCAPRDQATLPRVPPNVGVCGLDTNERSRPERISTAVVSSNPTATLLPSCENLTEIGSVPPGAFFLAASRSCRS